MLLHFAPPTMETLDSLEVDGLGAGFFADEAELGGIAGLVDWRLCGLLARLRERGRLHGHGAERWLVPGPPRLRVPHIALVGLGARPAFGTDEVGRSTTALVQALDSLGARRVAFELPGRSCGAVSASDALAAASAVLLEHPGIEEVTLLDSHDDTRELLAVYEQARRRVMTTRPNVR